jgi:hypothetical protein
MYILIQMFECCYLLIALYLSLTVSTDQTHNSRRKTETQILNFQIYVSHTLYVNSETCNHDTRNEGKIRMNTGEIRGSNNSAAKYSSF